MGAKSLQVEIKRFNMMICDKETKNSQALRAKLQTMGDRVPHLLIAGDSYSDIDFGKNWVQLLQQIKR